MITAVQQVLVDLMFIDGDLSDRDQWSAFLQWNGSLPAAEILCKLIAQGHIRKLTLAGQLVQTGIRFGLGDRGSDYVDQHQTPAGILPDLLLSLQHSVHGPDHLQAEEIRIAQGVAV